MDFKSLQYFLILCQEKNFTKASERLYISQPSLTRQIQNLEKDLGCKLFIRGGRGLSLTPEGLLLRQRAQEILELSSKTREDLASFDKQVSGKISLGLAECRASFEDLPVFLENFSGKYPEVTFDFYTGNADLVLGRIDQDLVDFGLVLSPVDISSYSHLDLNKEEVRGLLVKNPSRLSDRKLIKREDLFGERLIASERSLPGKFYTWFREDLSKMNFVASYNLISNAISLVKNDFGSVVVIDGALAGHDLSGMKFIPFSPSLKSETYLVWKEKSAQSPAYMKFLEEVYNSFSL